MEPHRSRAVRDRPRRRRRRVHRSGRARVRRPRRASLRPRGRGEPGAHVPRGRHGRPALALTAHVAGDVRRAGSRLRRSLRARHRS
ncbi:hypothetical protein DEA06_09965 [Microbacterium sp. Gd 4-13]|nr:hypothetical protein DEA06_09965 [Microbacterium sp. Gd 4-13]